MECDFYSQQEERTIKLAGIKKKNQIFRKNEKHVKTKAQAKHIVNELTKNNITKQKVLENE